jgi:hypothetical protein
MLLLMTVVAASSCDDGVESAADVTPTASSYVWDEVLPAGSGAFPGEWTEGKFPLGLKPQVAFDGELWMVAQTAAWSSPDGLTWTRHEKDDWGARLTPGQAFFDGKLWVLGGLGDPYVKENYRNDVWSSADGSTWHDLGEAPWSPRKSHAMVVYDDRLWLIGGSTGVLEDGSGSDFVNDVWSTADGVEWTLETGAAPWPAVEFPQIVVFDGALYYVGGRDDTSVWRSTDGKAWTQVAETSPWGNRADYAAIVYDGKIWVLGGWAGESNNALNDVWYSSDGATWTQQTESAPWADRSAPNVVFQDKLWLYSGKHTGAPDSWAGDVWTMSREGT